MERLIGQLQRGLYGLAAVVAAVLFVPYWLLHDRRGLSGVLERYGRIPPAIRRRADSQGCQWFHAASVGEVGVLARILPALAGLAPELPVVVTTVTATGRARARQLLEPDVDVLHLPMEAAFLTRWVVRRLHPQVMVIAETELWPGLLAALHAYGTPTIVVNGRLSRRSFRRYRLARPGLRPLLDRLEAVCVKSEEDGERFVALGARPERVHVVGDLKSEPLAGVAAASEGERRRRLGLPPDRPVFVAGSTREGEEEPVLDCLERMAKSVPDLLLVLAPRHMQRVEAVARALQMRGHTVVRRTEMADGGGVPADLSVLLLDTIGELEAFYAASDVAFVGGSLVPKGGHNLLEPAMYGKPVLFGPHTEETGGADELLLDGGGGYRVADAAELAERLGYLLGDREALLETGRRAGETVRRGRGALDRITRIYSRVLGLDPPAAVGRRDGGSRGPREEDEA